MLCGRFLGKQSLRCCSSLSTTLDFEEIPSPKGLPLIGNTLSLLVAGGLNHLHKYIDERHQKLGPIIKLNFGSLTAVCVSDAAEMRKIFAQEGKYPFHIKPDPWLVYNEKYGCSRGLLFMDGIEWLNCRSIMNKILLKGDLKWIDDCCYVGSNSLLDRISKYENAEFPNLEKELYRSTVDTIISILIGAESYKESYTKLEPFANKLANTVNSLFETTWKLQLLSSKFAEKCNIPRWRRFVRSINAALEAANEVLDFMKSNLADQDGLLVKMSKEQISEEYTKRIIIDLILGGVDTTAYTMTWMLYLLSRNRVVQERLRKELLIDPKTKLVRNIARETMRLYPAAPFHTRYLPKSSVVSGYTIPPNTLIMMSIYTSGRDENYYKNSQKFLPNRWLRENSENNGIQQLGSLPFGMGARSCVGRKIADGQLHITLSKIVEKYDIEICNAKEISDILVMILKPSENVRLKFNKV